MVTSLILCSCESNFQQIEEIREDQEVFKDYSGYDFDSLTYFSIPIDYSADSNYSGTYDTTVVDVVWDFDSVSYSGFYFVEQDSNGCVSRIGFSNELINYSNMSTDIFINDPDFNDWSSFAICGSSGKVNAGLWAFLKKVFVGVKKYTPCVMGGRWSYYDHWLVGDHGWKTVPC